VSKCLVAIAPCGHIRIADLLDPARDDKQRIRERAKWVAEAIQDGLEIQTVDTEVVRVQMGGCEKCDPRHVPKQERLAL